MPSVKLLHPVHHDGELYRIGDIITSLTKAAAARLVKLKAAEYADEEIPYLRSNGEGEGDKEAPLVKSMKKAELIAELAGADIATEGKSIAELREMVAKLRQGDAEAD